jgi:hypothetical protein
MNIEQQQSQYYQFVIQMMIYRYYRYYRFIGTEINKPVQIQIFEKTFKKSGKILQKTRENLKCSSEESFSNLHHLVS